MNSFRSMTMAEVEAHNARVAMGAKRGIGGQKPDQVAVEPTGLRSEINRQFLKSVVDTSLKLNCQQSKREAGLNKTEAAYLALMRAEGRMAIGIQVITLRLADDTRYTPDFHFIDAGQLICVEVKGFMRDDARVKLKVAAAQFPWIRFWLVTRPNGTWQREDVAP